MRRRFLFQNKVGVKRYTYTYTTTDDLQLPLLLENHTFNNGIGTFTSLSKTCIYFTKISTLKTLTIPEGIENIPGNCFRDCFNLTNIIIPNTCEIILSETFCYCSSLTSVTIPNSVTSIGRNAFYYCRSLTSINIPSSVTSIGNYAFDGTAWYNDQPYGVVYAGKVLYRYKEYKSDRTSINIKEGTLGIAGGAFEHCYSLTSVTIPNSVINIGNNAFYKCDSLTSVTIPNSVTSIGGGAFEGCSGLTNIIVDGDNLVYDSRENCNAIIEKETNKLIKGCKNTIIPNSVTSIGDGAFSGYTGLTSITIPSSVTSIGNSAFSHCDFTNITIGNSVTSIGIHAFYYCGYLKEIICLNIIAPLIKDGAFNGIPQNGILKVPSGSDYSSWMKKTDYGCLGYYNWTIEYI